MGKEEAPNCFKLLGTFPQIQIPQCGSLHPKDVLPAEKFAVQITHNI